MTQLIINTGNTTNDGMGAPLRTAFQDVNTNFTQLFNAGPVNSNISIANNTIQATNTNGNIRLATNGIGAIVPAADFIPDIPNVRSIGSGANRFNTVYSQYLNSVSGAFSGNVYVAGNLQVTGNVVTVNYSNLAVSNVSITLGTGAANAVQAEGGGILIPIAGANFTYTHSGNRWISTLPIAAPSFIGDGSQLTNISPIINANTLLGNTLAKVINYSNLQSFGNITSISATGNISTTGNIYANVFLGNIVTANILSGDGGNISNINANAIMGSIPYSLYANSAQTANLAALATQAVNSQTAILAQTANVAVYASAAGTATSATHSLQADNANAAVISGMAYELATTANISVTGNITTDGYFLGNGAYISGIAVQINSSNITFSNTIISTIATLEPIIFKTYDTANSLTNLWTFAPNGTLSAAGNIIVNNNLLFPGNAAVTTTIPGNILANVGVVALTKGINGNGWQNYLALDSNGNVHIAENSNTTSGSLIWDGGGSSIYESTTNGLVIASFAQYATIASGLNVQGNAFANNFSTIGNVYAGNTISGNVRAIGNINASYYFGNGAFLTGVTPYTGNIGFNGDVIYDIHGPQLNNSNLSSVATSGLVIPANANTQPATLTNIYGNIVLGASLTGANGVQTWTFDGTGNLSAPGTISATGNITGNYINGNGVNLTGLANITFGSTPPANAIIGDTWIDSSTGIQYVYFNDITGNIWAEMEAQTAYASVGYANLTTNTINTQVLYNASNAIVGSNNLTFDGTTLSAQGVTVGGSLQVSANSIISNTANGNLIINTTGTNAYINLLGGFGVNSYGGNRLIQTLNDTINFYTPILNSTDSCIDIIGSLDGNTLSPQTTGIMLHITGQPTLPSRIYNDAANTYAAYIGRAYNGNVNAPTQILANTVVSRIGANPYGNAGFSQLSTTRIDMVTTENQTTTNQGSQINFWATPTGSNTIVQTATLNSAALSVSGNVVSLGIVNSRNFINNMTTTVSSAANVTLTVLSNYNQVITGTAAQNFFLPNATTLLTGTTFLFNVNSSQPTYIYYQDATLLATVPAGGLIEFTLLSNGTANGTWDRHSGIPSYAGWGSSALAMGGANITGGTNISVTGIVSATGNVIGGNVRAATVITTPVLYTNLIAIAGSRAFITDGNLVAAGNFGNQVSGGGSNTVPVWSNGTNWYIG